MKSAARLSARQIFRMKFYLIFCLLSQLASGQKQGNVPKNFIGTAGGIEWGTTSGAVGIEYERAVYENNRLILGAKGLYIPRYKYGNVGLNFNWSSSISKGQSISYTLVMGTAEYFTAKKTEYSGFFLSTGLGASVNSLKYFTGTNVNDRHLAKKNYLSGAFELGMGMQFYLGKQVCIRFSGSTMWGDFVGAITLGKFAIGF